jgi:hypothetical protein
MARLRPRGTRRSLTTAQVMVARVRPSPAALVRSGLSPRQAVAVEREWEEWDAQYGFAWRTLAGTPSSADRARLEAGDRSGDHQPRDPPGFELIA